MEKGGGVSPIYPECKMRKTFLYLDVKLGVGDLWVSFKNYSPLDHRSHHVTLTLQTGHLDVPSSFKQVNIVKTNVNIILDYLHHAIVFERRRTSLLTVTPSTLIRRTTGNKTHVFVFSGAYCTFKSLEGL